jgi:Na+/H+ antiporter NhaC
MLAAERRALFAGEVLRPGSRPASANLGGAGGDDSPAEESAAETPAEPPPAHPALAVIPIGAVIVVTAVGLYYSGRLEARTAGIPQPDLREIFNHADSFAVLMWAALTGAMLAAGLSVATRRLSLRGAVDGWLDGARAMLIAVTILLLAWSLSAACGELHTADYLVEVCRGFLSARWLPVITFILAAAVSFATGTSWGTMAIMMPLVFPLGALLPAAEGLEPAVGFRIHLAAVSAVLAGAVFGDHCSPISDTTILSSLASGSDHVDHVRTQLPYSVAMGTVAVAVGYVPVGFGISPVIVLPIGLAVVAALVWGLGKKVRPD